MKIDLVTVFIACCGVLAQSSLAAAGNLRGPDMGSHQMASETKQNKKARLKRQEKTRQKHAVIKKQATKVETERKKKNKKKKLFK